MFGLDYDIEDTPRFEEEQRILDETINEEIERNERVGD